MLQSEGLDDVSDVGRRVLTILAIDLMRIRWLANVSLFPVTCTTYKGAKEDVDSCDEGLRAEHSLPEIPWVAHLSQESDEEKSTAPGVDHIIDPVELSSESKGLLLVGIRRWARKCLYGFDGLNERGLGDNLVVNSEVGRCDHTIKSSVLGRLPSQEYTHIIKKQTMFSHTERLASHPIRCKLRMLPKIMPTTMKMIMQTMKQMESDANCAMVRALPRTSTHTVMNCCSAWVALMKWRDLAP